MNNEPEETGSPLTLPTADDVFAAARRIEGVAHRTPVLTSRTFDEMVGSKVFFKCESFQRIGAFKFRGAYNALSLHSESVEEAKSARRRGVLAYSSGNHAQAVALASRLLEVSAVIVMPTDAPQAKLEATRAYGAEVILYDRYETTREALSKQIAAERELSIIPPYDHPDVIAGQGTVALEMFEQAAPLDLLLAPLGGGGLLSGCALAASKAAPGCRVVGVEPQNADDGARSFRTRRLHRVDNPDTIADGARTPSLGEVTFPLILDHVADVVTVSEEEIVNAMRFLWQRMKLVVEPTGAVAAAALLSGRVEPGSRCGVVLSGGNVDLAFAARLLSHEAT